MEWTHTHFRILFDAYDSSNLPELLDRVEFHGAGGPVPADRWPALELKEARTALLDLVRAGYVVLLHNGEVGKDEAVSAIQEDAPWKNAMPGTPAYYEIGITDEGGKAYATDILPRYWPEGVVDDS